MAEVEVERAQQLLDLARYDEALRTIGPVLERSPHDASPRLVAGWAARSLNQPEQAWEHASVAAQSTPDDGEALALMSLSDLDTGLSIRCDRARELGRRAVAVDPWNPVTHLALVYSLLDDPTCVDEARDAADAAARRFPAERALPDPRRAGADRHRARDHRGLGPGPGSLAARTGAADRAEPPAGAPPARGARRRQGPGEPPRCGGWPRCSRRTPTDPTTHAMLRAWLVGTSLTWSIGLGVVTLAELWSLLSDLAGSHAFAAGLGGVALAAAGVRATSVNLASGGAVRTAALADARIRWATMGPLAAAVLLAVAPWFPVLAVPLVVGAGVLLVVGAVNGARA